MIKSHSVNGVTIDTIMHNFKLLNQDNIVIYPDEYGIEYNNNVISMFRRYAIDYGFKVFRRSKDGEGRGYFIISKNYKRKYAIYIEKFIGCDEVVVDVDWEWLGFNGANSCAKSIRAMIEDRYADKGICVTLHGDKCYMFKIPKETCHELMED